MIKLYTYYRSSAAYRVRTALNYKQIAHELIPVNLFEGKQLEYEYAKVNPQMRVPTFIDGNFILGQSMAILEYLEEKYPEFSLLPINIPENFALRAKIRSISQLIACDMHPLNNLGVLKYLKGPLKHNQAEVNAWYFNWLKIGFDALENVLSDGINSLADSQKSPNGPFCFGDKLSMADICLIPQIYNAFRFEFPMEDYPKLLSIYNHCLTLDAFDKARPENQIDASPVDLSK